MCRGTTIAIIATTIITGGTAIITATGIKLNNSGRLARGARFTMPEAFAFPRARQEKYWAQEFLKQGKSFT